MIFFATTWTVAASIGFGALEFIRVNFIQKDLTETEDKLSKYEEQIKLQNEEEVLLISAPVWVSENERLFVLGGQVSVKISLISNVDEIRYAVDAVGEDEI